MTVTADDLDSVISCVMSGLLPITDRDWSVRAGTFCRFGFEELNRPVAATVWLNDVCTRPVSGFTISGRAST